jgi:FkbM family methyltransferase
MGGQVVKSYSTFGEDAIFEGICRRLEWVKGESLGAKSYIDIGAFHPEIDSNVCHFYKERGWAGSTFEPNTIHNYYFETGRPRDKFYNFAVSDQSALVDFYIFSAGDNSNTINPDFANHKKKAQRTPVETVRQVQTITLDEVFDLHREIFGDCFLLSIDAEGEDAKIINGSLFNNYRPAFIMIEDKPTVAFMPNLGIIRSLLAERNYFPIASSLMTTIYVDGLDGISNELVKMGRFDD